MKQETRRRIGLMLAVLLMPFVLTAQAQMKWNQRYQTYIDKYKDLAIMEMLHYHIPASITLAQGLLESGAGQSELARQGNNHFGIKCHGWTGRTTYFDDDARNECFRAYDNVLDSYEDHSKFLTGSQRYRSLFALKQTDYKGWARGLKAAGYATSPTYAQKLIEIIELYRLYEYDTATSYDHFMSGHAGTDQPGQSGGTLHPIFRCNKNYYLRARKGDTFETLALETGISRRKLAKYNERRKNDVLAEGEIVYLKKKQSKADKSFKRKPHTVVAGESMYDIAQRYGIRLKSLYKKNHLPADYQLRVGDQLRVY